MSRVAGSENPKTTSFIDQCVDILAQQNPMTVRQLFYALVSSRVIDNSLAEYQRVSGAMKKARDDERVPWDWIVDHSRPFYGPHGYEDAANFVNKVRQIYSRNHWHTQPEHIEVWCEKDATVGSFEQLCWDLNVGIRVGRGYSSTTNVHNMGEYFNGLEKPIFAFYLGDHDPSGVDMIRDIEARVRKYLKPDVELTVQPLAIFKADIQAFNLPPLPLKKKEDGTDSDSRAKGFRIAFGTEAVELDALPVTELRRRISESVKAHIDTTLWERSERIEINEKGRLADAFNQITSMTDEDAPTWAQFQSLREDYPKLWKEVTDPEAAKGLDWWRSIIEQLPHDPQNR
jgi:hypothetical protein